MKKIISLVLSAILSLMPLAGTRCLADTQKTAPVAIDIFKTSKDRYKDTFDLDFLVEDDKVFVDGTDFLEALSFMVEDEDKGLYFRNYDSEGDYKSRMGPFSNRNIDGGFIKDSETFEYSYIFPGLEDFKSPAKPIEKSGKVYIPFTFILDVLDLDYEIADGEILIKSKPLSKTDVMLDAISYMEGRYLYHPSMAYDLDWSNYLDENVPEIIGKNGFIIDWCIKILKGDYVEAVNFESENVADLCHDMMGYKSLSMMDEAKRNSIKSLKTANDLSDIDSKINKFASSSFTMMDEIYNLNSYRNFRLKELRKNVLEPGNEKKVIKGLNIINKAIKTYASSEELFEHSTGDAHQIMTRYFDSDKSFSDVKDNKNISKYRQIVKDELDRTSDRFSMYSKDVLTYGADELMGSSLDIASYLNIKLLDGKEPPIWSPKKGSTNVMQAVIDALVMGVEIIGSDYLDSAESFDKAQYSILFSKIISSDLTNYYYDIGKKDDWDKFDNEDFKWLEDAAYTTMLSTYTSLSLMDDHLSSFSQYWDNDKDKTNPIVGPKSKLLELLTSFELAADEDIEDVAYSKKANKNFLKTMDDSDLIDFLENDKKDKVKKPKIRPSFDKKPEKVKENPKAKENPPTKNPTANKDTSLEDKSPTNKDVAQIYQDILFSKIPYKKGEGNFKDIYLDNLNDIFKIDFGVLRHKDFENPLLILRNKVGNNYLYAIVNVDNDGNYYTFSDLEPGQHSVFSTGIYEDLEGNLYLDDADTGLYYALGKFGDRLGTNYGYTSKEEGYLSILEEEFRSEGDPIVKSRKLKADEGCYYLSLKLQLVDGQKRDSATDFKDSLEPIDLRNFASLTRDEIEEIISEAKAPDDDLDSNEIIRGDFENIAINELGFDGSKDTIFIEDFDNNDTEEALVVIEEGSENKPDKKIYLINQDEQTILLNGAGLPEKIDHANVGLKLEKAGADKYLLMSLNNFGPGYTTYIIGVDGSEAYFPQGSGQFDLFYKDGDTFIHSFTYLEQTGSGGVRVEDRDRYSYDNKKREFVIFPEDLDY